MFADTQRETGRERGEGGVPGNLPLAGNPCMLKACFDRTEVFLGGCIKAYMIEAQFQSGEREKGGGGPRESPSGRKSGSHAR